MPGQDWLIEQVNRELNIPHAYERYCAGLRLEELFTTDSVYLAAKRCASGFMRKNDTWYFQQNPWVNSRKLCLKVLSGTFRPGYYRERIICERGKQRVIRPPVYECKVVQKVLCDYLIRPLLEPKMISTSYASVKGRGTKKMYEDILTVLNRRLRQDGKKYTIVQTDLTNYFGNIDVQILIYGILGRYIRDTRILELFHAFSPDEYGLSLGNEASQIPASFFPSAFDHYCKDAMGWDYFRYMDDAMVILPEERVAEYRKAFLDFVRKYHMCVREEKIREIPLGTPFVFCKERFLTDRKTGFYYRLMNPAIGRNEARKLRTFRVKKRENLMTQEAVDLQYGGVKGAIASHPNTWKTRKRLEELYQAVKEEEKDR